MIDSSFIEDCDQYARSNSDIATSPEVSDNEDASKPYFLVASAMQEATKSNALTETATNSTLSVASARPGSPIVHKLVEVAT